MIAINAFIIYQSCLPEGSSKTWSDTVVDVIKVITGGDIDPQTPITPSLSWGKLVRKVFGHFSLFMINGVFTYLYFFFLDIEKKMKKNWLHLIYALSIGVIVAIFTELLQLVIPGRFGDIVDILIDIGGYLFGVGVTYLIIFLIRKHKNKKLLHKEA